MSAAPADIAAREAGTPATGMPATGVPGYLPAAIERACRRIAPLWPLRNFVAVNPFLGFTGEPFAQACATLRRVAQVDALPPRGYFVEALAEGRILDVDLEAAIARTPHRAGKPANAAALRAAAARAPRGRGGTGRVVATVADVLDAFAAVDWRLSRTAFMVDEISRWCAAWFDEGQAAWRLPSRTLRPYAAWRAVARHDRTPEVSGVRDFRRTVAALPEDPVETIAHVLRELGIPQCAVEDYLYRALFDIQGWAAYARHRAWESALRGIAEDPLPELLAIRIAWGYALFAERDDAAFRAAWAAAVAEAATLPAAPSPGEDEDLLVDGLLQEALEAACQRRLLAQLAAPAPFASPVAPGAASPAHVAPAAAARPPLQAAFCIDVRSEAYRRALEAACPGAATSGFAGFFGFPIEYVPIGRTTGGAQCPVLLAPRFIVCESVSGATPAEESRILGLRLLRRRVAKAWKAFKLSAVSSFAYVESAGLLFAAKLFGDSVGYTRTVQDPGIDGLDRDVIGRIGPRLEPRVVAGRSTGFDAAQRVAMAEAVLRAMSMTGDFARLVLLVGHGSSSANNPHASGLDCGACGGHTGEANARVAAAILNDPAVRAGLRGTGIDIPGDTWFIGALHDTTTDDVRLFDLDTLPGSHRDDLEATRRWLAQASSLARAGRCAYLGLDPARDTGAQLRARSRDWSQVRPEWGLAGNAAFIAAPRARTLGLDLGGRAFLHEYDWRKDGSFGVLELIMTAPMVVASWINLQYYGSAINNRAFGSGNKTLHNVVGQLGVLEGGGGDLKVGLPWQSVHDGRRLVHEPVRLNVFIAAPTREIDRVIARHEPVRELVENGWVHLFALGDERQSIVRRHGGGRWEPAT